MVVERAAWRWLVTGEAEEVIAFVHREVQALRDATAERGGLVDEATRRELIEAERRRSQD